MRILKGLEHLSYQKTLSVLGFFTPSEAKAPERHYSGPAVPKGGLTQKMGRDFFIREM